MLIASQFDLNPLVSQSCLGVVAYSETSVMADEGGEKKIFSPLVGYGRFDVEVLIEDTLIRK